MSVCLSICLFVCLLGAAILHLAVRQCTEFCFCLTMLCASMAYAVVLCLSVCLSICHVCYCINTSNHIVRLLPLSGSHAIPVSNHIVRLLPLSGSHAIPVFPYQTLWQYFDGDVVTGAKMAFLTNIWQWERYDWCVINSFMCRLCL